MNTAVFELLGKLASDADSSQPSAASPHTPLVPLQTSLPTEKDCALYGQEKPLLFFYDPRSGGGAATATRMSAAAGSSLSSASRSLQPSSAFSLSSWSAELSPAKLAAPTASVQSLCVTAAEDDVTSHMPSCEVWAEWPQTVRGWHLCSMSHLCAVLRRKAGSVLFYLLASRYELVGTSAVYERYLLLAPPHPSKGDIVGTAVGTTSISVHELRTLRRLACLCRCFCTNGCEVQPRASRGGGVSGGGGVMSRKDTAPPVPPADFFLRLVPTSLQYTFCCTTTALLSVAEEERSQGWAMATAKLSQHYSKATCRRRSCSTEAENTSGALSDGCHTVYQDSSFSRERSASAVRVVDGATILGYNENPRSATSTPARPLTFSRVDEQQQPQQQGSVIRGSTDRMRETDLESRLPPSQRWRALSLLRLVDTSYYDAQVPAGWRRWRYASNGILCRPLVVDSLDGIVRYIHGSRLAFYTAVAFLDRFIAATVDPISNFQAYRRQIYRARTGQEMDFSMMAGSGKGGSGSSDLSDGLTFRSTGRRGLAMERHQHPLQQPYDDEVHARDICSFLTQVIVVCIMLGCKTVDLYPPRIRQLMGCVEDTAPITEHEFVVLELHVLLTLGFPVHPVTLFESVNTLLTFSTSDELYGTLTASHTARRLLEEYQDRGHIIDDVDKLLEQEKKETAAAALGMGGGGGARSQPTSPAAGGGAARSSARSSSGYCGRPTESLTQANRQAMNDWLRLRLFSYFICDEVLRADVTATSSATSSHTGSRHSTPHTEKEMEGRHRRVGEGDDNDEDAEDEEWSGGFNVLQYAPILVATAALVTAAEQLCVPLPAPLLRLLPLSVRDRLRECDDAAAFAATTVTADDVLQSRRRFGSNEGSSSMSRTAASPGRRTSPVEAAAVAADTFCLTAQPTDDNYKVLEELSLLVEAELVRLSVASGRCRAHFISPPRELGTAGEEEDFAKGYEVAKEETTVTLTSSSAPRALRGRREEQRGNAACDSSLEEAAVHRHTSSFSTASALPRADPYAVELMGHVILQVKVIHERSRESCPPVLLQRYQSLFRETV